MLPNTFKAFIGTTKNDNGVPYACLAWDTATETKAKKKVCPQRWDQVQRCYVQEPCACETLTNKLSKIQIVGHSWDKKESLVEVEVELDNGQKVCLSVDTWSIFELIQTTGCKSDLAIEGDLVITTQGRYFHVRDRNSKRFADLLSQYKNRSFRDKFSMGSLKIGSVYQQRDDSNRGIVYLGHYHTLNLDYEYNSESRAYDTTLRIIRRRLYTPIDIGNGSIKEMQAAFDKTNSVDAMSSMTLKVHLGDLHVDAEKKILAHKLFEMDKLKNAIKSRTVTSHWGGNGGQRQRPDIYQYKYYFDSMFSKDLPIQIDKELKADLLWLKDYLIEDHKKCFEEIVFVDSPGL